MTRPVIFGGRKRRPWWERNPMLAITLMSIGCIALAAICLFLIGVWVLSEPTP